MNPPKWVRSAWMMSTLPPSMNGAASQIAWIRSPVAIDVPVARRTRARAAAFSGGTGSSIQRGAIRLERDRELGRRVRRETAVHLDHEVDVRADRLADGGHDGDRAAPVWRADPDARRVERVELHRPVATRHHGDRKLGDPGGLEVGLVPAVRVGGHAIAEPAPEELPDRDAEVLADEVEGGDVERGERGLAVLARPAILETLDRPGQSFGVERIGPDDVPGGELLDDRDERVGLVDRPDLADAGQAGVGLELDEHELAPGCPDDRRPDVGDLHVASSGTGEWRAVRVPARLARAPGT